LAKQNIFMTIQQVIQNEKEINNMMQNNQMMQAFTTYYGDDVVMIQNDGTTHSGKADCQIMEENWVKALVEYRGGKLLNSVVMPSDDSNYEYLVVATWFVDFTSNFGSGNVDFATNQTSLCYWSNDKIRKVTFKFPSEVIA
jgi:hypothetical protein